MKIRTRLILSFIVIALSAFYFLTNHILRSMRPHYLETMEEVLVDQSHVLAAFLEETLQDSGGGLTSAVKPFRNAFEKTAQRAFSSKIYELTKTHVDERIYVTDEKGVVLFDSDGGREEGKDYSKWRDVFLTLRGEYGARMSHPQGEKGPSVMHVAAPIRKDDAIIGSLTVAKPTSNITTFIQLARPPIILAALIAALSVILLGILVSTWITHPIQRLTSYAKAVRDGRKANLPVLGKSEMREMGHAFEEMREALEGKKYVEHYVQHLTHELKSPIAAVQGAAEILQGDVPPEKRTHFLKNIQIESKRMKDIIDRLLELASLESRRGLQKTETIDAGKMVAEVADRIETVLKRKSLKLKKETEPGVVFTGEKFLIEQALMNLLQNAVDFAPPCSTIRIAVRKDGDRVVFSVEDQGSGLPEYAKGRVFEKFYSLPRPDTGKKSSGLGLSFAQEIARLHNGEVILENRSPQGLRAVFSVLQWCLAP